MEYKNYEDLEKSDIWTTDGINCNFAMRGKDCICTELESSEANYMVPAETLPENLDPEVSNQEEKPLIIEKKSTWEFNPGDQYIQKPGDAIVDTLETWIYDKEEDTYILDAVNIAETGEEIALYEIQKDSDPLA